MKSMILYKSKYGATKQYADWLAESLELPAEDADEVSKDKIKNYDVVFIGTSVYFGKFLNERWLRRKTKELSTKKKIFLFIVCASAADTNECNEIIRSNVPIEIKDKCAFYFLPGKLLHHQLSLFDRFILRVAGLFLRDPLKKQAMHNDLDEVKRENLNPLIIASKGFLIKAA